MQKIRQKKKSLGTTILVVGMALFLAGCGAVGEPAAEGYSERGEVVAVDAPLRAPEWAEDEGVAFALREDGRRLVMLDSDESLDGSRSFLVTLSEELEGTAGENLTLERGRSPDFIYLPVPERDRAAAGLSDSLPASNPQGAARAASEMLRGRFLGS